MQGESRGNDAASSEDGETARNGTAGRLHDLSAEAFANLTDAARQATEQAKTSAASVASEASDQIQGFLRGQIGAGADLTQEAAEAARAFAGRLDKAPHVAELIRGAADGAERFSKTFREKTPGEIVELASNYARRQPGVFIGAAAAIGFLAIRFLNASPPSTKPVRDVDREAGETVGSKIETASGAAHDA